MDSLEILLRLTRGLGPEDLSTTCALFPQKLSPPNCRSDITIHHGMGIDQLVNEVIDAQVRLLLGGRQGVGDSGIRPN